MSDPPNAPGTERTLPCRLLTGFKRRASVRHPCCVAASSHSAQTPGREFQETWVVNLSISGVGLLLRWRPEPDTTLAVRLEGAAGATLGVLWAQVVHTVKQGEGEWYVGCAFPTPLNARELRSWLAACDEG